MSSRIKSCESKMGALLMESGFAASPLQHTIWPLGTNSSQISCERFVHSDAKWLDFKLRTHQHSSGNSTDVYQASAVNPSIKLICFNQ
jgi:hypothetical protein